MIVSPGELAVTASWMIVKSPLPSCATNHVVALDQPLQKTIRRKATITLMPYDKAIPAYDLKC